MGATWPAILARAFELELDLEEGPARGTALHASTASPAFFVSCVVRLYKAA